MEVEKVLGTLHATHKVPGHTGLPREEHRGFPAPLPLSPFLYGNFITAIFNFLITAAVIFLLVKGMNTLNDRFTKKEETPAAPTTKKCPYCCSEIPVEATRCAHCTSQLNN